MELKFDFIVHELHLYQTGLKFSLFSKIKGKIRLVVFVAIPLLMLKDFGSHNMPLFVLQLKTRGSQRRTVNITKRNSGSSQQRISAVHWTVALAETIFIDDDVIGDVTSRFARNFDWA